MTDDKPFLAGPNLSSVAGLQEAGVLESFHFDPIRGLAGVIYSPAYLEILRSGPLQFTDPAFLGAVILDDPVAIRIWVDATAARLAAEAAPEWSTRGTRRRRPEAPQ